MTRYALPSGVMRAQIGQEEVLLNTETRNYHLLRGSGPVVVAELEAGHSIAEIRDRLAKVSDTDPAAIDADIRAFVVRLLERGLLTTLEGE
jgi:hypothetical protein